MEPTTDPATANKFARRVVSEDIPIALAAQEETITTASVRAEAVQGSQASEQLRQDFIRLTTQPLDNMNMNYNTSMGDQGATSTNQFEVISGLTVTLCEDAEVNLSEDGLLVVRAKNAVLGDSLVSALGVCLQAKVVGSEIQDLVVSMEGMSLDPLMTRDKLAEFLDRFGLPKAHREKQDSSSVQAEPRNSRMTQEEWEEFLLNVQTDTRPNLATLIQLDDIQTANSQGLFQNVDMKIPNVQVKAVQCGLPSHKATMDFPDCQGSNGCTVRTLVEYYARAVIDKMDLLSGHRADVSISAVASDVASAKASMIGASVGTVLLGPAGFVAGSYLGNRWMRQSSSAVKGGAAGLTLFGPVGLVAGAIASESQAEPTRVQPRNSTRVEDSGQAQRKSVVATTADHVATNKYEYAGSAGVLAGAAMGMAIAGPIGLVAGSVAGSLGGRKLVESTTSSSSTTKSNCDGNVNDQDTSGDDKPYRFGDFTRRIVARGKESRSANTREGYRFGDFTRGIFS